MTKGPLVTAAAVLATILIILSFAVVLVPEHIAVIGAVAGVVALIAVIVMVIMFFRMKGQS
ncbi:MAG: hypothetical protein A3205_04700 [Methanomassiliicoccales archaeon Mx-03]|nr:MAG: hypothetical protein A3205_04700 [Methanomassiliicoccales archaeon Mx-03]